MFSVELTNNVYSKFPKKGKCKKSVFSIGWHRVGIIPLYRNVDTGLTGWHSQEICLECGKIFKQRWFITNHSA